VDGVFWLGLGEEEEERGRGNLWRSFYIHTAKVHFLSFRHLIPSTATCNWCLLDSFGQNFEGPVGSNPSAMDTTPAALPVINGRFNCILVRLGTATLPEPASLKPTLLMVFRPNLTPATSTPSPSHLMNPCALQAAWTSPMFFYWP
jgi:hypothetical protein